MALRNLQALRGVAALIVFLIHLLSTRHGMGVDGFLYRFWWVGPAGVDLFFVISGFIICLTASRAGQKALPGRTLAMHFAAKRFFRIFPVYWLVLALAFLAAGYVELAPAYMPQVSTWQLLTLTTTNNNKVMLAWTLAYELYFYAVLAIILLLFPRSVFRAVGFWIVGSATLIGIAAAMGTSYLGLVPMSPLLLEFGAGCVIAFLVQNGIRRAGWESLIFGIVMFAIMCWVHSRVGNWEPWIRAPIFTLPCALIVYGAVTVELVHGRVLPGWLQRLGDASYSLYIWHQLVLAVMLVLFQSTGLLDRLPPTLTLVLWAVGSLGVGFISYYWLERPIQAWANRRFADRPPTPAALAE